MSASLDKRIVSNSCNVLNAFFSDSETGRSLGKSTICVLSGGNLAGSMMTSGLRDVRIAFRCFKPSKGSMNAIYSSSGIGAPCFASNTSRVHSVPSAFTDLQGNLEQ